MPNVSCLCFWRGLWTYIHSRSS